MLPLTSFFSSLVISSLKQMLLPDSKDANSLRKKWIMEPGSGFASKPAYGLYLNERVYIFRKDTSEGHINWFKTNAALLTSLL